MKFHSFLLLSHFSPYAFHTLVTSPLSSLLAPNIVAGSTSHNVSVPFGSRLLSDESDSQPPATVKYDVNGARMSYDMVLKVLPEDRTIAHWRVLLDWNQQRQRPYVIVDPWDPSGLLYLRYDEYLVQMRTLAASNVPVLVIARPGSKAPVQYKTPPLRAWRSPLLKTDIGSTWRHFRDLRKWIFRNTTWGPDSSVKVHDGNIGGLCRRWYREVSHLLGQGRALRREPRIDPFVNHLIQITKLNGVTFAIQRLKISLLCLYSYLGGNPLETTEPLGQRVRLSCGLPAFLGVDARRALRTRSPDAYRLWSSLLNIYKALYGKHGASPLETIEAAAFVGDIGDFSSFVGGTGVNDLWERWTRQWGELPAWKYQSAFGLPITSAGANMPLSLASLSLDAVAWCRSPRNWVMEWFTEMDDQLAIKLFEDASTNGDAKWLWGGEEPDSYTSSTVKWNEELEAQPLTAFRGRSLPLLHLQEAYDKYVKNTFAGVSHGIMDTLKGLHYRRMTKLPTVEIGNVSRPSPVTGRLHSLYEAAGKVRIIAICDYFTQMALYPVHMYIFSILKGTLPLGAKINIFNGTVWYDPKSNEVGTAKMLRTRRGRELLERLQNDATFDQQTAVDWFAAQGHKEIFSYDLKTATELIPRELYVEVLAALMGRKLAELWMKLLSDREFLAPRDLWEQLNESRGSLFVRYGRGQPMGAYSSWAALALVHHALVQYAAAKAGYSGWFLLYLVLGDDIVIACPKVAEAYLEVCAQFGIKVGLAKSLVSKTGLMNFASQTLIGRENVSPISLKEVLQANTWEARAELSRRVCHRLGLDSKLFHNFARRVLSVPQWGTIVPELTGLVPEWNTRFIRWFLHNPVRPFDGRPEWYKENVVSWLGLLSPVVLTFSSELVDILERNIAKRVWAEVRTESAELLRHFQDARSALRNIIETLNSGHYEGPTTVDLYIAEISLSQVKARCRDFAEFRKKWEAWLVPDSEAPQLTPCLQAWSMLHVGWKLPGGMLRTNTLDKTKYMLTDLLVSKALQEEAAKGPKQEADMRRSLPRDLTPLIPDDTVKVPLKAILLGLADTVGVALPVGTLVPKFFNNRLTSELRRAKDEYWLSRARQDASPCVNTVGLEACQVYPMVVPVALSTSVVVREGRSSYLPMALVSCTPYMTGEPVVKLDELPKTISRLLEQ